MENCIDFQSLITKLVDMIQATKDEDPMWQTLYMSETVSLGIHMKHVQRYMCDIGMGKMSVSVMTTMPGSNETLHNTLWNVLPLVVP